MSIGGNLSVVIPTYNCSNLLDRCLKSVKWADEIIVVDMGSTDNTLAIAKKYKSKIFIRYPINGNFDENRKYGMQKCSSQWILKIDSDEYLTSELSESILQAIKKNESDYNGYLLFNKIIMFGKVISTGVIKNKSNELRLVKNGFWKYFPYKYHQQIYVSGKVKSLKGFYYHENYRTVNEFIQKTNKYTELDSKINANQKKVNLFKILVAPYLKFFSYFILQGGYKQNIIGFETCFLFSLYNFIDKIKTFEKQSNL